MVTVFEMDSTAAADGINVDLVAVLEVEPRVVVDGTNVGEAAG